MPASARRRQGLHKPATDQWHLLPDRPDAETGRTDGRFRHRAQRAGARGGALGEPDVGADRTQSAGRTGQHRAEYRQHRGGGEVSASANPSDIFPTFLALNSNGAVNQGYLSGKYAPFKVTPSAAGISNTTNPTGQTRFENRFKLLNSLDDSLRTNAPNGAEMSDYNEFYIDAKQLMYNSEVNRYFGYHGGAEHANSAATATGNAMLVASQVLKADLGTRFIQITSNDGWDMHSNIYAANNLPARVKIIDDGLSALINDLKANGTLRQDADRDVRRIRPDGGPDHGAGAAATTGRSSSASSPAAA